MTYEKDAVDVLLVSLGATGGLRSADEQLLRSLRRAGATAAIARAPAPRAMRTLALTDLSWALAARRAAVTALDRLRVRALIYSSTTAAALWPRRGAIRFDALAVANRPGRHGLWQRPLERRRLSESSMLLPWSEGALGETRGLELRDGRSTVVPVAVEPSPAPIPHGEREIAAFAYVANPHKKGLDRILAAWSRAATPGEQLVLVGASAAELRALGYELPADGVRVLEMLPYADYRTTLKRARVFVCAARREDYGIAQLEALADGCLLVTVPSPGPYAALPIARQLDSRLVSEDLATALRVALDEPAPDYAERATLALAPYRRAAVDRVVAEELLPRLLG